MAWRARGRSRPGGAASRLGRLLVERACEIARDAGYARINVISAIGTVSTIVILDFMTMAFICKRSSR